MPKPKTAEFAEDICGDCLDIIVNGDPHNMGWTPKQYLEWQDKFAKYCGDEGEDFIVTPADGELSPHFSHYGCPICADRLACNVYRVTFTQF